MPAIRPAFVVCLLAITWLTTTVAVRPLVAQESLPEQIDRLIAAETADYDTIAAPLADDAEFLRRVYLDLTGIIPTIEQARTFLNDPAPDKRVKLIDQLIASPEFSRELARKLDVMLMLRRPNQHVPQTEWHTYLQQSTAANKPWNQLVAEVLSNDGTDPATRSAARFVLDRGGEVNEITRDIGRVFLGMNLECAQCHDHPQIDDYKQHHYYGIAAFFVRSSLFTEGGKGVLAENAVGEVKFESVFEIRDKTSTGPKTTFPRILEFTAIEEPKFDFGEEYARAPAKDVRPIPKYSRRQMLADAMLDPANKQFPRNIANRLWSLYFGRGLVHPLDLDHTENPPSHPALLDLLTENMVARNYDMRSLIRELVLTRTYQRSSLRTAAQQATEQPADETFAVSPLRGLSAEQLSWAVMQATGFADDYRANLGAKLTEESFYNSLVGVEQTFRNIFGEEPGKPAKGFEASIDQTLYLMNEPGFQGWTRGGKMTRTLTQMPADNPAAIAEELYLGILTRKPSEVEVQEVTEYLQDRTGEGRALALQELVWALLTSAEFRFIH